MAKTKKKSNKPNTKTVPSVIVLGATTIVCFISISQHTTLEVFVTRLVVEVLVFLLLGTVIKMVLDYAFKTMDEPTLIEQLENNDLEEDEPSTESGEGASEASEE